MIKAEKNRERAYIEKALRTVEQCAGNCKKCEHCKLHFADVPGGIVYCMSCEAAGRWGAYCEDFRTMRTETLDAIKDFFEKL